MAHHCHARGCSVAVKPELLMCRNHWFRVPLKIREAVWAAYRDGQCADKRPSREWMLAAEAAIGFIGQLEGRPLLTCEGEALTHFDIPIRRSELGEGPLKATLGRLAGLR